MDNVSYSLLILIGNGGGNTLEGIEAMKSGKEGCYVQYLWLIWKNINK